MIKNSLFFLMSIFLIACGKRGPLHFEVNDFSPEAATALNYQTLRSEIFSPKCISCHKQYDSYEGVKRELTQIMDAVSSDRMPKNSKPLTRSQKELLQQWITAGAPRNGNDPTDNTPAEGIKPEWKSISENIITPKCLSCHNPEGQAKFLDLSSRQEIFSARNRSFGENKLLINFEQPNESYLIEILKDEVEPMPPQWSNLGRLTDNEIAVIQQWIGLGLP